MPNAPEHHSLVLLRCLREQAPRLCDEAGFRLPEELLVAGLPTSAQDARGAALRENLSLTDLTDSWVARHPDRKGAGLFLTPADAARRLLAAATRDGFRPRSVLDPAVGGGVFLTEALVRFDRDVDLFGVDNDPVAVALTRLTLWLRAARLGRPFVGARVLVDRIRWADALFDVDSWKGFRPARGFDLVCGNPPFGNAIEKRTARTRQQKVFLKVAFPESARGPYDRSVLFVELSERMLSKDGRLALLLPRALLSARYAEGLRSLMAREAPLVDLLRYPEDAPVPEGQIAMVGWIAHGGAKASHVKVLSPESDSTRRVPREVLRSGTWGGLLHPLADRLEACAGKHPKMAENFTIRSGAAVAEAYEIAGQLVDGGEGWRFLTAGQLIRYGDRWGERRARHLGRTFTKPVLPFAVPGLSASRRALYASPKIVVAGLSRVLEATYDRNGECAAGVGTLVVIPRETGDVGQRLLRRSTLLLNSAYLSELHRSRNGPMSLSGGNLPLGRRDIEGFPFPACLALPAAQMSRDAIERCICCPGAALPDEEGLLLALLDATFDSLSEDRSDAWDHLAQRVILELVGCNRETAGAILEAWGTWMSPKALSSSGPPSDFRGNARGGGSLTRAGCTEPRSSACSD